MAKTARTFSRMSFVTLLTHGRRPVFEVSRNAELFIETLLHYRTFGHYKLHAYLVLPTQVHLLLSPETKSLEQALDLIKYGFSYRISADSPIWDRRHSTHPITNIRDLELVRRYLHQLPVRAHLCESAELYPHSSAHRSANSMPGQSGLHL